MINSKVEEVKFKSECLNSKDMALLVYLPEDYDDIESLPVLYFFHGRRGDENILNHLGIDKLADKMIKENKIKPMIIVCPRMQNSRGINSAMESSEVTAINGIVINVGRYEDYFIDEIVPLIDSKYKTIKDRSGRYIGGASAGGYIALHNALRHQELFSKVGGHMPAIELTLEEEDKPYFKDTNIWNKYDPIYIASNNRVKQDMKVYLDAGDEDEGRFFEGCSVLYDILNSKNISVENHVFKGNHSPKYILSNLEKYLTFYGQE